MLVVVFACWLPGATAAAAEEQQGWEFEVGTGVIYAPDYSGAKASSARLRLWADGVYHTTGLGSFAIDSGSLTIAPELRWDFVDSRDVGAGVLVGYRTGRNDRNPGFSNADDGSARLRGLPNVNNAVDAGVAAHVAILGIPLFAQLRVALNGSQGTLVNFGAYVPISRGSAFEVTVLPTITWANARQMRAFYGVDTTMSTASRFAAYGPRAGLENAALEISGDWRIAGGWHLIVSGAYQRLLGNAARSPLVQTSNQTSALTGITWHF